MPTSQSVISEHFAEVVGRPCWQVSSEYGTWLSLNFGQPSLHIREGNPEARLTSMQRRQATIRGSSLLWVEMGGWELLKKSKRLFHSGQSRGYLRKAASQLDGQLLDRVEIIASPLQTSFFFDHGSELRVFIHPESSRDEPLWHLYTGENCLSLLANGILEHGLARSHDTKHTRVRGDAYAA
jgi:hypothetical protein